jgi:hypothetical protein
MDKYSETIHKEYPVGDFEITGDLNKDVNRWKEYMKIPYKYSELDISIIRNVLFRLSFGKQFTVHTLTDGVVEKVKHIIIENMPKEMPIFMKKSFLIEARHDKNLFENIRSIGGFIVNNEINLIIITDDKIMNQYSQIISKSFDGRNLNELNMVYKNEYNIPYFIYMKERKDIFTFVLKFALMMEAEKTPLIVETKGGKRHNANKSKPDKKSDWIERRVYLDKTIKYQRTGNVNEALDKDGKSLKETLVHGFLRLQHFGKGLSESKWIFIDNYNSKRWVNSGDTRITIDLYDKQR